MTRKIGRNAVVAVDFVARMRIDNPRWTGEVNFHTEDEFASTREVNGPGGVTMIQKTNSVSPDPLVGTILEPHRYEITRVIGQGGFGTVYEAKKQPLGRRVAIKRLAIDNDSGALERFEREARILAKLEHPSIVSVIEFFQNSSGYFIVMEFVEGKPLSELIATQRLTYEFILRVMRKVFSAVAEGHKRGVIHRDLKAENIIVFEREDRELIVKVLDYGIARVTSEKGLPGVDAAYTNYGPNGFFAGTPYYMAPEVASGKKASEQADVFSLGVLMYYAVTNSLPYTVGMGDDVDTGGALLAILAKQLSSSPVDDIRARGRGIGRDVPDKLADAIMKALAKDPGCRWKTVIDFRDAIEEAAMDLIGRASTLYSLRPSRASVDASEKWSKEAPTLVPESLQEPTPIVPVPAPATHGFRAWILAVGALSLLISSVGYAIMPDRSAGRIEAIRRPIAASAIRSVASLAMPDLSASVSGVATSAKVPVGSAPAPSVSAPLPESAKRSLETCLERPLRGNPGCAGFCAWCDKGGKHSYCSTSCLLARKK